MEGDHSTLHDSIMAIPMIDAVYDSTGIYDYIMDNTHAIPLIDTNRGIGIVPDKLTFKRNPGIIIREREKARYRLRWEIERTFSILEEILHSEHIWYVRSRNYDVVVGERIVAYNCILLVNQIGQRSKR